MQGILVGGEDWTVDSACSKTMKPSSDGVTNRVKNNTSISLADDSTITASLSGKTHLPIQGSPLIDTLVVPQLHEPLLSVAEVCDKGHSILFTSKGCTIHQSDGVNSSADAVGSGYRRGNLYYLPSKVLSTSTSCY